MKLSIRSKLLGAFAIDLVLMFLLGGFALAKMARMGDKAEQVETYTIPAMRNVDDIHDQVGRYRTLQLEYMVHTNAADKDRIEHLLDDVESAMTSLLDRQKELLTQDGGHLTRQQEIHDALGAVEALWMIYVEATHSSFLPAIARSNTGTVQPAFSRLNPTFLELSEALARLARLDEEAAQRAMEVVRHTHQSSRTFILTDTALSLLLSASVGLLLASTLARRIRRLSSATRRVAGGDLDQHVAVTGGDELALLAENFNEMVASLRRQHLALELRHRELQSSFERQRTLTDDLVRRKEAEEAASRARAEAEARDSAKSLFLATMSHELRTPLNAILGFVQVMKLEASRRGDGQASEDLLRIDAAGKHLLSLISNLLDFSKIEQDKMELDVLEFCLADLAREVVAIVEPLAAEKRNQLLLECEEEVGTMRSDPVKLRQILFNLLSNAVKFTDAGTVSVSVDRIAEDGGEDRVYFRIEDTGIGIEKESIELIFEPFRQAEGSTTRRFGGTGLGLVVSRQLCQLLGGDISVSSRPGAGSTFTVTLPATAPSRA